MCAPGVWLCMDGRTTEARRRLQVGPERERFAALRLFVWTGFAQGVVVVFAILSSSSYL